MASAGEGVVSYHRAAAPPHGEKYAPSGSKRAGGATAPAGAAGAIADIACLTTVSTVESPTVDSETVLEC